MFVFRGKINWFEYAKDELFVIILPSGIAHLEDPIHLYWQWSKIDDGSTKVNVCSRSFISSYTDTADDHTDIFSCTHDDYYIFDITSQQDYSELVVTMRNPNGDTSQMTLERAYTYQDDSVTPFEKPRDRIYVGKLDWYEYAVNELFIITLPSGLCEQEDACAFWQWTKTDAGVQKEYVQAIDTQKADDTLGNKFHFVQNSYYTFSCDANESSDTLAVTMKNPNGDSVTQTPLVLQEIINRSEDRDGTRRKRALKDYTLRITNDLDGVVTCTFSPSASSTGGKLLAVGGFGLALAGLIPTVLGSGAFLTPFGWAIAIVSVAAATTGVVDVAIAGDEPTTRPLFPNDDAANTSSGGLIFSANNISILHMNLQDGTNLVCRVGSASNVDSDVSWRLSDSTGLKWSNLFSITLPKKHKLDAYRALPIHYIQPDWDGTEPSDDETTPSDYALCMGLDGTNIKSYKTTLYVKKVVFRVALDKQFVITQSLAQAKAGNPASVGDYRVIPLSNGNILVSIDGYWIEEDGEKVRGNRYANDNISSEEKVKEHALRDREGWAYVWDYRANTLTTWRKRDFSNQIVTATSEHRTYFLVPGIRVTTHQLLREV